MNFRKWLIAFFDPTESIALFLIGTSALTIVLAIIYDTIKEQLGLAGAWGFAFLLLLVVIGVIVGQYLLREKRKKSIVVAENKPDKKKGLILLLSPTKGASIEAINYHLPRLRVLWLISTTQSAKLAADLNATFQDKIEKIHWGEEYEVDPNDPKSTFNIVKTISLTASNERVFRPQLIADITGGTKPMSVGMTLACLAYQVDIQYMKTIRKADGSIDEDAQPVPIQIDISVPIQVGQKASSSTSS